ncbi:MAG: 50S ribosomal protein L4 [Thermodesulfobacteriota bacterium]|uniref:Large ribosomal subunit protein uL4 n=1 Tax=Desulfosudis oleivorans (strain DSM 6200 / JCM 39069 / Hxd3) TaxID=96561 RepID=RL4_DESOH|nr:50S ribosomal protein L4 [Desulfosudis oleivorans]A8ZV58.1 RecName: Full=Large ribosomal subunit protein uL4; AltName: Full=50S ribosomal protein L4 [Desulfosudis oleivorans Hxd3]ABW66519.1 ribosomal protein L4/L1e [Desulfosudis oleivorans Hxd3]MDY6830881.1 50S ribosomal protein L4 [Thermodesulfobacteriota bacterium]
MAVVDIKNMNGETVSQAELPDSIFDVEVKSSVLHEVVKMQLARRRSGTASTKGRSDVAGSRAKLFRQKGTGRARRGDVKSPLLKGGGVVFGPHPRSFDYSVPKKVRKLALKMALTSKLRDNTLTVVDQFRFDRIKTKDFVGAINALGAANALVISDGSETLEKSARNVPKVKVLKCEGLNVYDILKYKNLVLPEAAIKMIEGRLL